MTESVTAGASLPIARLRAHGARVSHLLGHWPAQGIWGLSVTLPDAVPLPDRWTLRSRATLERGPRGTGHRVIVQGLAQRGDARPSREDIRDTAGAVAELLTRLADHVESAGPEGDGS